MDFPHVAHVVLSLDVGGLERLVAGLTCEGVRNGGRVTVICLERPGDLASEVEAAGGRIVTVGKRPGLRPGLVWRLADELTRHPVDVLHTHQIGALLYAGPAAAFGGVRAVVHTEHGNHLGGQLRNSRKTRALYTTASHLVNRFCCVSEDIAVAVRANSGIPSRKLSVVANGVDTDPAVSSAEVDALRARYGLAEGTPVVGTVGRLAPVKRQDVLLEAFAQLRPRRPDARLLVVGDGPERSSLEALARHLRLSDAVVFVGQQPRPEPFYRLMSVFALTSASEGMPVSLLEAWAAGVPAVCTAVGGVPELITDGHTGLLVPPSDPAACASALGRLLAAPAEAAVFGAAGRTAVVERYSRAATARRYAELYRSLLKREKPCGFWRSPTSTRTRFSRTAPRSSATNSAC